MIYTKRINRWYLWIPTVILLLAGSMLPSFALKQLRANKYAELEQILDNKRSYIEQWMYTRRVEIQSVAQSYAAKEGRIADLQDLIAAKPAMTEAFSLVRYIHLEHSLPIDRRTMEALGIPAQQVDQMFSSKHMQAGYASQLYPDSFTNDWTMVISYPARGNKGQINGLVVGLLSLKPIETYIEFDKLADSAGVSIWTPDGRQIGGAPPNAAFGKPVPLIRPKPDTTAERGSYMDRDGRHMYYSTVAADNGSMLLTGRFLLRERIVIGVYAVPLVLLLALLCIIACISFLRRNKRRGAYAIYRKAEETIRQGQYDVELDARLFYPLPPELSDFIRLFNRMMSDTRHHLQQLEQACSTLNSIGKGIIVFQSDGEIIYMNPEARQLLGFYSEAEANPRLREIFEEPSAAGNIVQAARQIDGPVYRRFDGESMKRNDQTHFPASIIIGRRADSEETESFTFVFQDNTRLCEEERQARLKDRLEAIGRLAAGMAHEIRNPLTTVKGFLQMRSSLDQAVITSKHMKVMLDEIEQIEHVLNQFLVLARPQAPSIAPASVVPLLQRAADTLGSGLPERGIFVRIAADREEISIDCEADQLLHAFINIMKNAVESMPDGGNVNVRVHAPDDQGLCRIEFQDEGSGIPKHYFPQLGNPFFTTKDHALGLGLMTSIRIVHRHRGTVSFSSQPGHGTVVNVTLPLQQT